VMSANAGKRVMRLYGAQAGAAVQFQPRHDDDQQETGQGQGPKNAYGFDLHAGTRVAADDRQHLERLCRYLARPPLSNERLVRRDADSYSVLLKSPWRDGTIAIVLTGIELIGRLIALIPPPHIHLIRYFGIFAPNAKLRAAVVPVTIAEDPSDCAHSKHVEPDQPFSPPPAAKMSWAVLMKRVWGVDVLCCPKCGSRMQRIATIMDPKVIRAMMAAMTRVRGPP
jgi:hypothetical protein